MSRLLSAVCILLLLSATSGFAQFTMAIGPTMGINWNNHSGDALPQSGSGFGLVLGGQADMMFTPTIGLIGNLQFYDNRSGSYDQTASYGGVNGTLETSASLAYLMIEPLFKIQLVNNPMYFFAGPAFGFNTSASASQSFTAPNIQPQSGSGNIPNTGTRIELKGGGGYDFALSPGMTLSPQLSIGYGMTDVTSTANWKILTIQATASLKFPLVR